jgi:hypothetical protein
MDLIAQIADWVRHTIAAQAWLAPAHPHLDAAPDLALVIPAPIVGFVALLWFVGRGRKSAREVAA